MFRQVIRTVWTHQQVNMRCISQRFNYLSNKTTSKSEFKLTYV